MKNLVRFGSLVLALGLTGLLAGCASSHQNVTQRPRMAHDFEVVETSTKRTLNAKEMAVLRAKVADYLDKQGATSSGDYYVKVFLGADQAGAPAEWVIVRFSRDTDLRFQLLGSADSYYGDYGYRPYASYDYYPAGYDNFSRVSLQYYDEPYYGGGYYFPPPRRDDHDRNHHHDSDHDHDGDHDHGKDRDHDGNRNHKDDNSWQEPPHFTPGNQPPQVTHTRWDRDTPGQNNPPHGNGVPHHGDATDHHQSDHSSDRTYTPPARTSSQSAPRTETSSNQTTRSEPSFRTPSQSAPSYSAPAARSAPSPSSSSNQNSNRASAQRDKSE